MWTLSLWSWSSCLLARELIQNKWCYYISSSSNRTRDVQGLARKKKVGSKKSIPQARTMLIYFYNFIFLFIWTRFFSSASNLSRHHHHYRHSGHELSWAGKETSGSMSLHQVSVKREMEKISLFGCNLNPYSLTVWIAIWWSHLNVLSFWKKICVIFLVKQSIVDIDQWVSSIKDYW